MNKSRDANSVQEEIKGFLRAGYPILYLYTPEENRTLALVRKVAADPDIDADFYTHDLCAGLRCERGEDAGESGFLKTKSQQKDRANIPKLFDYIETNLSPSGKNTIIVLKNPEIAFQKDDSLVRQLKNFIEDPKNDTIQFGILSSNLTVWQEIEKEIVVIDIPYPTREEIRKLLAQNEDLQSTAPKKQILDRVIEALNGLTEEEIAHLINYCIQDDGELTESDLKKINHQKKQIAKKSGALEFVDSDMPIDDIGGLETLKDWIQQKKKIFSRIEEAMESGVDMPKGLLLAGMPGCGKSLAAKAISSSFGMPLLRLDMGAVMGPYVGQSEENLRKAIKMAEAISPSVLWIDELEKALAGSRSGEGGGASSETGGRILGTILTWMQEKTSPVFIVATANNVTGIPPEFLRKGRFDENFFVDLPSEGERKNILKIHLKKRKQGNALTERELAEIAKACDGFSGADIEALAKEEVERAFLATPEGEKLKISFESIKKSAQEFYPISKMMPEEIAKMKNLLKKFHFKPATK